VEERPLRILFAAPAWWPSRAFGGPIPVARELVRRLVDRGHTVDVVTTTLVDLHGRPKRRSSVVEVDGATVRYLATPLRYRWMGITPSLPLELRRTGRPDVAHLFGFRDVITTVVALWCRRNGVPYVFEPLGMFFPRVRKIRLKRLFDRTVARHVAANAAVVVATSEHELEQIVGAGVPRDRVAIRRNGFPVPEEMPDQTRALRDSLGLDDAPIVLYVGRIAAGKGIEHLLDAARAIPELHLVLAGPDDGHGMIAAVEAAAAELGRVHRVEPERRPLDLYGDADVFALPSAGESFGMVAAEAASAGTAVVVTDRCGIAEVLRDGGAIVVPYDGRAVTDAIAQLLSDPELRRRLGERAREIARRLSWAHMVERQEELYRSAIAGR
jgi:glycosyltransferase involved in cell wall biosynthesis